MQLLCVYILKKGVNIEWTNQGCLQSRLQEQASWLFLSIVLNCIGIYCYYICIHCIFFLLDFYSLYQNIMILFAVGIKGLRIKSE